MRAFQAEREVLHALSRKVQEFGKHVETICAELDTAKDELGELVLQGEAEETEIASRAWNGIFIQRMGYCSAVVSAG